MLNEFKDIEINKYIAECRMVDGSIVCFGSNYRATILSFNEWLKYMLYDDSIHTDDDTYIKSENIIEIKLYSKETEVIKYRYEDYFDSRCKCYYSNKEI